jgi:lipopolysaccharide export system protein LptC
LARLATAFPLILVACLAALTYWLERTVQPPAAPRDGSTRHDPDYIVEKLVAVRLGSDGVRLHQLEADKMVHYPDDDTTHLDRPRFLQYDGERLATSVVAKRALVSSEGKIIDFNEGVKAVRVAVGKRSDLVLTTDYLQVIPDDDLARTDRPVVVTDANTQLTAVGLELDNKAKTVKLMSEVRGTYVRTKK